jgi:hypothetical protein
MKIFYLHGQINVKKSGEFKALIRFNEPKKLGAMKIIEANSIEGGFEKIGDFYREELRKAEND